MTEETKSVEETAENTSNESATNSVELNSFYGIKAGMTRIFDEAGNHIPVTVIKLETNYITQIKTKETDGYEAYQVGFYAKREKLVNKPTKGRLAKANVKETLTKFAEVKAESIDSGALGKEVSLGSFGASTPVDVTGKSKGKGFQGVIKKYNFAGGPMTHGSKFHRSTGSIGNRATPGKVWKNKKMPGHMGSEIKTVQNLSVVEVNAEKGYMLIRGSVPGSKNSWVRVSKSVKK
ncbi:MAG: 50S ribosomal protein L3 [Halobacteriovoraceae bacterium]|jgi:large subunit ribosomal protein L3|nr:50S ribosomal protein L3 [Halobacteriovoraceae bacterium]